jgi:hypothetical protein
MGSRASPNRMSPNAAVSEANATRPSGPSLAFSQLSANEPPMAHRGGVHFGAQINLRGFACF